MASHETVHTKKDDRVKQTYTIHLKRSGNAAPIEHPTWRLDVI